MKREKINYYKCDKEISFDECQKCVREEKGNYNYLEKNRKEKKKNNYYGR